MSERKTHEVLRVLAKGDIVAVQPADASGEQIVAGTRDLGQLGCVCMAHLYLVSFQTSLSQGC